VKSNVVTGSIVAVGVGERVADGDGLGVTGRGVEVDVGRSVVGEAGSGLENTGAWLPTWALHAALNNSNSTRKARMRDKGASLFPDWGGGRAVIQNFARP
jgi:hypothetical protein